MSKIPKSKVIRVDAEVIALLGKYYMPGDSWNAALRRALGLPPRKEKIEDEPDGDIPLEGEA